jgi:hypothetical protein
LDHYSSWSAADLIAMIVPQHSAIKPSSTDMACVAGQHRPTAKQVNCKAAAAAAAAAAPALLLLAASYQLWQAMLLS